MVMTILKKQINTHATLIIISSLMLSVIFLNICNNNHDHFLG